MSNMPIVNTRYVHYISNSRTFVGEISTVEGNVNRDVCGGFMLKSERTGNTIYMIPGEAERDREGEVLAWNFSNPNTGLRVRLFND